MDDTHGLLQKIYYTVGTLSGICAGVWFLIRSSRSRIAALNARIDHLESQMVTRADFQETIERIMDREDEWKRQHEKWGEEVMRRLDSGLTGLRDEVGEIRQVLLRFSGRDHERS